MVVNLRNCGGVALTGAANDMVVTASSDRFASATSRAVTGEIPLADIVRNLAHCEHPEVTAAPAVILEPNGERMMIFWCGRCGALCFPGREFGEWIPPSLCTIADACTLPEGTVLCGR